MKKLNVFDLQRFADSGTLVNTTTGSANAYTGEVVTDQRMSPTMKTFYDTALLKNARPEMIHEQFAQKQGLPANSGDNVEWRKFNKLPNATKLTEGVIPTGQNCGMTHITDSIDQYGIYVAVSDKVQLHAVDNVLLGVTEELGASGGKTQDELVRNDMALGTSVMYAPKKAGDTETEVTYRYELDNTARITPTQINKAATFLKKMNAPRINGKYVCLIHPSISFDLRECQEWIEAHKYSAITELFRGEIGELHGVRFVEGTQAKIIKGTPLTADAANLTVAELDSSTHKVITVDEAISAAEATAIAAAKFINVKGKHVEITACASGAAGAATITLKDAWTTGAPGDGDIIYPGDGAADGSSIYFCTFLGKDAYATIDPTGGAMEMIYKSKEVAGGPLNQFATAGYKLETNGAKILYEEYMVRLECCSSYGELDEAN